MDRQSPARLLFLALLLGLVGCGLFYGQALGISVVVFDVCLLATLGVLSRLERIRPVPRNLWPVAPLLFLAVMVCVRANPFLTFLNVSMGLGCLGLLAYFYAAGRLERLGMLGYPLVLLLSALHTLFRPITLLQASIKGQALRPENRQRLLPILRGSLLALPILSVFACLLASADLIFAHYLKNLVTAEVLREIAGRSVLAAGLAWIAAGGMAYALARRDLADAEPELNKVLAYLGRALHLGLAEAVTILASVSALLLAFGAIQFAYLFGGQGNITLTGFTYADYARRGFGELVTVAVLSSGLILGLRWLTVRPQAKQRALFNGLSTVLVGLVLVLLASAFQRLRLYEAAYGYTELRLYVYVFMGWLAALLVWLAVSLWWRAEAFAPGLFVAALGLAVTLNLLNPDALIARQNLARYQESGKIDVAYLSRLSEDAVPELVRAAGEVTGKEGQQLEKHLRQRRKKLEENRRWQSLPAYHLSRWRAYELLAAQR